MCSLTITQVLHKRRGAQERSRLEVLSYNRMCSLTIECVVLLKHRYYTSAEELESGADWQCASCQHDTAVKQVRLTKV